MVIEMELSRKYEGLFPHLDERQRRLVAAADAKGIGRGGVSTVARACGLSRPTIHKALGELDGGPLPGARVRREGGGRKRVEETFPGIAEALEPMLEADTRGDPMSPLKWTCKSTRHLAGALSEAGFPVSHPTVASLLEELGYSLQGNVKSVEGRQHPDRDEQFRYISRLTREFQKKGLPVISVDTKKKELIGQFAQAGREWRPKGEPERVQTYDFIDRGKGKAIPYGVYDIGRNEGWVNVGCDHDTATFAAESIRRWWARMGRPMYEGAREILVCADGGGSNGYRLRLWKVEVQRFSTAADLAVTVCHFPPGTSKWNKIEHRLFSHITMNWRGRPLVSHDVVVKLIGSTTTDAGLRVKASLDKRRYPKGVKVTDSEIGSINLTRHDFHGEWNYTLKP